MKVRQTLEYETTCPGCGSMIRYSFGEIRFEGRMDQRIPCPVCGWNNLVVQGGAMAPSLVAKTHDRVWKEASGEEQTET